MAAGFVDETPRQAQIDELAHAVDAQAPANLEFGLAERRSTFVLSDELFTRPHLEENAPFRGGPLAHRGTLASRRAVPCRRRRTCGDGHRRRWRSIVPPDRRNHRQPAHGHPARYDGVRAAVRHCGLRVLRASELLRGVEGVCGGSGLRPVRVVLRALQRQSRVLGTLLDGV
jgi:hypothetical protein